MVSSASIHILNVSFQAMCYCEWKKKLLIRRKYNKKKLQDKYKEILENDFRFKLLMIVVDRIARDLKRISQARYARKEIMIMEHLLKSNYFKLWDLFAGLVLRLNSCGSDIKDDNFHKNIYIKFPCRAIGCCSCYCPNMWIDLWLQEPHHQCWLMEMHLDPW